MNIAAEGTVKNLSHEDFAEFAHVMGEALRVHDEKEGIRHGLWKDYPALDQTRQIKVKAERIIRTLELAEGRELTPDEETNISEEYEDIINYSVFGHRIVNDKADPATTKGYGSNPS